MGILESLFRFVKPEKPDAAERQETPLDVDREGKVLFASDIVNEIKDKLEKRKSDRRPFELQWTLNSNFLAGNQYCEINPYVGEVKEYEFADEDREHNAYNRIAPLMETRMANLKSIRYRMQVNPRTNELDDREKAMISTDILRYIQTSSDWDGKCDTILAWAELTGTAFVLSWWDTSAGEVVAKLTYDAEEEHSERDLHAGDLRYGLLTPWEVYPENVYKEDMEDQESVILEQVMTVEEVKRRYNIDVDGESVDTWTLTPVTNTGGYGYQTTCYSVSSHTVEGSVKVITYFERSGEHADGVIATIIGDRLVQYGRNVYGGIPIVAVKSKNVSGQFYGKSCIQELIPLQREYNLCLNKIGDFVQTVATNTLLVEEGSIDTDEYEPIANVPGAIVTYKRGYSKPDAMDHSGLPSEVVLHKNQIATDMEYVAGVSQLMVMGNAPSGVTSGTAIENLRQIDSTRLSLTGDNVRAAIKRLAVLWLKIYREFATGYRVCSIAGSNSAGSVTIWTSGDINSYDVEYTTENELKQSPEARANAFIQAYNMGLFTDDNGRISRRDKNRMIEILRAGSGGDVSSEYELQVQNARFENAMFERGVIDNNISEFDDDEVHVEEHKQYILQLKFRLLEKRYPAYAQAIVDHVKEHQARLDAKNQQAQLAVLGAVAANGG